MLNKILKYTFVDLINLFFFLLFNERVNPRREQREDAVHIGF